MKNTRKNSIMYKITALKRERLSVKPTQLMVNRSSLSTRKSSCFPLQGFVTIFNITYGGGHVNCEL